MPSTQRSPLHVVALALLRPTAHGAPQLFVARRGPGRRHGGLWELPGGQVEAGETERAALVREAREELSIEVTLDECIGGATVATGSVDVHMVVYVARSFTGTMRFVDHDAHRWIEAHELEDLSWAPADLPHLPALHTLLLAE